MQKCCKHTRSRLVDILLYLVLGGLLVCLVHGEQNDILLREKTSNLYSEDAIAVHLTQADDALLDHLLSETAQMNVCVFYEYDNLLACNSAALSADCFHLLSGEMPEGEAWAGNVALIGRSSAESAIDETQMEILGENVQIVGVVGYEGLYALTDSMTIVPLDFCCRQMENQLSRIIVDGSLGEINQFRSKIAECYSESCSVQPVKSVGAREVFSLSSQTGAETALMLVFVMLFALFEHVLYLFEGMQKNIFPFVEMGFGTVEMLRYILRKTIPGKMIGLLIGVAAAGIVLQADLRLALMIVCGVVFELTLGTILSLEQIVANVRGGNDE